MLLELVSCAWNLDSLVSCLLQVINLWWSQSSFWNRFDTGYITVWITSFSIEVNVHLNYKLKNCTLHFKKIVYWCWTIHILFMFLCFPWSVSTYLSTVHCNCLYAWLCYLANKCVLEDRHKIYWFWYFVWHTCSLQCYTGVIIYVRDWPVGNKHLGWWVIDPWVRSQFSLSVVSDPFWPCGLQHARLLCPSPTPGGCSNSCPSSQWET